MMIRQKFILEIKNLDITNENKNRANSSDIEDSFLTIHKSKSLQADAVLVVARTEKELLRWIETDKEKRINSITDDCRVGYVVFSRSKEFLCIACKAEISHETLNKLKGLNVTIY